MSTKELVRKVFIEALMKAYNTKPEVMNFLLNHERLDIAIERITHQIRQIEFGPIGKRFTAQQFQTVVVEGAKWFAIFARQHADEHLLSHAERQRRIDQENELSNFEAEQAELKKELKI